jgi:hypothetical protein
MRADTLAYLPAEHPEQALSPGRLAELRDIRGLAICPVAGRDAVAAAVASARTGAILAFLPVAVATGTEFGDPGYAFVFFELLRALLDEHVTVLEPIRIGSPRLWRALNGRPATVISRRFGVSSPCLACHLYVHIARVPLSWALGGVPVVTGERDTHDGRIKLSQTTASIDAEKRVFEAAGIELLTPVRSSSSSRISALTGDLDREWPQLDCVHSGNYKDLDGRVEFDEPLHARYVAEFFEPVGLAIVEAWRETPEPDYDSIVADVLRASE